MDVKTWKKEFYEHVDSLSFTSVPDHRGRITIPVSVRKKLKIRADSMVLIEIKKILGGVKDERWGTKLVNT